MISPLARLRHRWRTAAAFAGLAHAWTDRPALFLAGIARGVPFSGNSFYARIGRGLGREVLPRIKSAGGFRISLDLSDLSDLMIVEEIFIDGIYPLDTIPFEPETIVDCGACAGFFAILSHAKYPAAKLHVFEPEPGNLKRLRRNLTLNRIAGEVHPAAVGLADGKTHFSGQGFGGHVATVAATGSIEVKVVGFPHFLRTLPNTKLLLKIDIEGAEAELLPAIAGLLPQTTALFLETHHREEVCRAYLQPLLDAGFLHTEVRRRHDADATLEYVERLLIRA